MPITDAELLRDAYDRRIATLYDTLTGWAAGHGIRVTPAGVSTYSLEMTRNERLVTVRLISSQELRGFGDACVIVEDEDSALRMVCCSGDSGMPTAAALKGLLIGLLAPEIIAQA